MSSIENEMTPGRVPRGTYAPGAAARSRIIAAASTLFGQCGYRGASLDEIARVAGITKQGMLHHFPNKLSLVTAVLQHRDDVDTQGWPEREALVGAAMLDAWDRTVERNVDLIGLVRLSHVLCAESSGSSDHPARQYFHDHFAAGYSMLVGAFEKGVACGELRADLDCAVLARQVIAMLEGLENQWLLDPENIDIVALFHAYTVQLRI